MECAGEPRVFQHQLLPKLLALVNLLGLLDLGDGVLSITFVWPQSSRSTFWITQSIETSE